MAKLIKELKKENEFLKGKCEKSDIALVKLVEEVKLHACVNLLLQLSEFLPVLSDPVLFQQKTSFIHLLCSVYPQFYCY